MAQLGSMLQSLCGRMSCEVCPGRLFQQQHQLTLTGQWRERASLGGRARPRHVSSQSPRARDIPDRGPPAAATREPQNDDHRRRRRRWHRDLSCDVFQSAASILTSQPAFFGVHGHFLPHLRTRSRRPAQLLCAASLGPSRADTQLHLHRLHISMAVSLSLLMWGRMATLSKGIYDGAVTAQLPWAISFTATPLPDF